MLSPDLTHRMITRRAVAWTVAALVTITLPIAGFPAFAQARSGRFFGAVYDATHSVIPNATVVLSNPKSQTKDIVRSDAAGAFEITGLPAGDYLLDATAAGFRTLQTRVMLRERQDVRQDVTLQVGSLDETMTVSEMAVVPIQPPSQVAPQIRVGGKIRPPRMLRRVQAQYPEHLRDAGIEGTVLMDGLIGTDGTLVKLRVLNAQVHPDLAKAAADAVNQWQWEPTLLNGVPVEVSINLVVNFRISE